MSNPNDDSATSKQSPNEPPGTHPSLRINLLRWDSEWLQERLAKVQQKLDRALDEVEGSRDP